MKRSEIQSGHYYEKKGSTGWLRLVIRVWGDQVTYIDFVGLGRTSDFGRWAQRGLAPPEAEREFPKEVAKIDEVIAAEQGKHRAYNY